MTDRALDSLRGLKRLRTLRLANTYVSGQGLESLKSLPAIEGLDLTLIEFTPAAARIVGGLRTLQRFRYADAADETLAELTSLSELEDLELWSGGVTDQGVDHLLKLSKLRKLAIRGSQLSDAGLLRLADLPRLVSLDIGHASGSLSAVGIKRFQEQKAQCKVTFEQSGIDNADKPDRNEDKLPREPPDSASANVLWGEPVEGLRLGIRSAPYAKSATRFRYGDWLRYEIWIRNETTAPIHIPRDGRNYYRPALKDRVVNLVGGGGWGSFAVPIEVLDQATLTVPAGQSAPLLLVPSVQTPVQALGMPRGRYGYMPLELSLGKHQVLAEQSVSYLPGGVFDRNRRDFKSVNLRSAAVEIEVLPAARLQVTEANELAGDWTREYVDEDKSLRIVEVESGGNGKMKIVLNPNYEVLLDNEDIAKAEAKPVVGDEAHFAVHLELTAQAAERFARETKRIAERGGVPGRPYSKADGAPRQVARQPGPTLRLAILLDGKLLSAPRLIEPITDGKVMITGNFTREQADALATAVRPAR